MAAQAYIDTLDTLETEEQLGALRGLTRKARVQYPIGTSIPTDYNLLWLSLGQAGVPVPFTQLFDNRIGLAQPTLVLVSRSAAVIDKDNGWVDCILKYAHILDGPHQILFNPVVGTLYGKSKASIVQQPTNFYQVDGGFSGNANRYEIQVAHTFSLLDKEYKGQTIIQGGEVQLPFPQGTYHLEGVSFTSNPLAIRQTLLNSINAANWLGEVPGRWLCSDIQFDCLDPNPKTLITQLIAANLIAPVTVQGSPGLYRFQFEWQFNSAGWNPTVIFVDQRTGRPPANLKGATTTNPQDQPANGVINSNLNGFTVTVQYAGYWTVPSLRPVDYNDYFGATFEVGG